MRLLDLNQAGLESKLGRNGAGSKFCEVKISAIGASSARLKSLRARKGHAAARANWKSWI
jgi:hypothetical protein